MKKFYLVSKYANYPTLDEKQNTYAKNTNKQYNVKKYIDSQFSSNLLEFFTINNKY